MSTTYSLETSCSAASSSQLESLPVLWATLVFMQSGFPVLHFSTFIKFSGIDLLDAVFHTVVLKQHFTHFVVSQTDDPQ